MLKENGEMEKTVTDSTAETGVSTHSRDETRPVGLCALPWHIVEEIVLEDILSYPDTISVLQAYFSHHQAVKEITSSTGRFGILWEKKFKQVYPDLYRLLCGSRVTGHEKFTWHDLLKQRWETDQSVAKNLKAFRRKNMEEILALLQHQEENLIRWLTDLGAGDLTSVQTVMVNGTADTQESYVWPDMKAIVFVGNGRLANGDFHTKMQFQFYNRALANMIFGHYAGWYDEVPSDVSKFNEVPLLLKLMVVDACRDHTFNALFECIPDLETAGPAYDIRNTMRMCQTAVGYHQIYLYTQQQSEMLSSVQPKKEVAEDFVALINFLQACYPFCTNVLKGFYEIAYSSRNVTFSSTKKVAHVNEMLRNHDGSLSADDFAFACGFICNLPYISTASHNLPPIVTFLFLADRILSNEYVSVILQKLTLKITAKNEAHEYTDFDDIYLLLPCVRVDGIDHFCIPNSRGNLEIYRSTDNTELTAALHRRFFKATYGQFGAVRDVTIMSVTAGGLMDHFGSYMKYLVKGERSSRSRTFEAVYLQSKRYGGSLLEQICQLFTNVDRMDLAQHFSLCHTWTKPRQYQGDHELNRNLSSLLQEQGRIEQNRNRSSLLHKRNAIVPVGTVVRIKCRNILSVVEADGPEHFAVVVSWDFKDYLSVTERIKIPRITYYCVRLDAPHAEDPYYLDTCARVAKQMTVADGLPEDIQIEMLHKNPVLWRLFDGFDGMFFTLQPALRVKFPDDWAKQEEIRKKKNHVCRFHILALVD